MEYLPGRPKLTERELDQYLKALTDDQVCYDNMYRSAINICVAFTCIYALYASHALPECIIKLRTNFSRAKLIVKRIFLTIQSHNLKSHKALKSKLSNSHNFIFA